LKIEIKNRTETRNKEDFALKVSKKPQEFNAEDHKKVEDFLIEKMAIYLAKMSMHNLYLSSKRPSLLAVGSIYVALKICEQLKKKDLINTYVVTSLIQASKMLEEEILDVS
jgi:hypothetical protein